MRYGWIVLALIVGAIVGAVGVAALPNATVGSASLLSYASAPEGQEILVLVGLGRLDSISFVDAQDDANAVRVNVSVIHSRGAVPADMKMIYVPVALQRPLGERSVLDATGRPVPRRMR
jgi:hypothetical protein